MELLLVRHGVTGHNRGRIFMGWDPVPLADEGREQVARLGRRLRGERIDRLISSDVARALESAEILSREIDLEVETTQALREVDVGEARGLGYEEAERRWPGILDVDGEVRFPGGESFADLADRAAKWLRDSVIDDSEARVLVVSHGGVVRGIAARLLDRPLRELDPFAVDNASLSVVRIVAGRAELTTWNDTAHLD